MWRQEDGQTNRCRDGQRKQRKVAIDKAQLDKLVKKEEEVIRWIDIDEQINTD